MPEELLRVEDNRTVALRLKHLRPGQAQLILVVGQREKGKTYLIQTYLNPDLQRAEESRVLALDPFSDLRGIRLSNSPEEAVEDMEEYRTACRRRLEPPIGDDSREYADDLFQLLVESELRDYLLVLDEVTLWTSRNQTRALQTLVLQGRRLGVRILCACQQLSLVPGIFLSECTELVVFRTNRPRDLEVLEDWGGKRLAELARNLAPRQAILLSLR
jgi:hypothetical protein